MTGSPNDDPRHTDYRPTLPMGNPRSQTKEKLLKELRRWERTTMREQSKRLRVESASNTIETDDAACSDMEVDFPSTNSFNEEKVDNERFCGFICGADADLWDEVFEKATTVQARELIDQRQLTNQFNEWC